MNGKAWLGTMLLTCALAGCSKEQPDKTAAARSDGGSGTLVVRTAMKQQINPITMAIWEIGNNAIDENGQLDATKLDDAKWAALADQAGKLGDAAGKMAAAGKLKAADQADTTTGEGEVPMEKVQRRLDTDPAGFREHALKLAAHADQIGTAARAKDGKTAGDLISGLDGVCESCHLKFWDPGPQ